MKFGVFYELQLPRPWGPDSEHKLFQEALDQIVLADQLGIDHAWAVEHHFLEEYSHCSAPEVFLSAAAGRTKRIRLGHGIRQVIANYNHPARTAEVVASLDLVSSGRVDLGIGEGATRLELGGFGIPAKAAEGEDRGDTQNDTRVVARADRDEGVVLEPERKRKKKKARGKYREPSPAVSRQLQRFRRPRSLAMLRLRSSASFSHLVYAARSM